MKRFYVRTNKRGFASQITKHEQRERILHQIAEAEAADQAKRFGESRNYRTIHLPFSVSEPLAPTQPSIHYDISRSRSFPIVVPVWLSEHTGDPALLVSFYCLIQDGDGSGTRTLRISFLSSRHICLSTWKECQLNLVSSRFLSR